MTHPQVPRPQGVTDPLLDRVLEGRYRVVRKLGEGGMGNVYLAEVEGGGRVAVKVLHDHLVSDADQKERFEREARALFGLDHPNILHVHDFGVVNGLPYLVMELLDGVTLDRMIEESPPDPETALEIARQVLSGLAFAHGQGVLHRDLKTENVFIARTPGGKLTARLLDFGLVKFVDDDRWGSEERALTAFGEVFGTPAYMSPEQATGAPVGPTTDVYSMGVVLFELLTGAWPFMEETRVEMFRAHMMRPPPSLAETNPEVEFRPELETLVKRALAKEPKDRFPDAGAMLAALEAIPKPAAQRRGAGVPLPAATHEPTWVPSQPLAAPASSRKSLVPLLTAGGAVALLVSIALAVALFVLL